jgi:2-polyprenyl-3-methyl-5-hydroxy-6-metoxy-1,4-benzoquinol methylase
VQADALGELPPLTADVVTNSLFLHHVHQPEDVIGLLRNLCQMAKHMVVISDLRRSRFGLVAAWTACRALTRSHIVHHDGPASVRAAWTLNELQDFAAQAGMTGARIHRCPPWRMLLVWEKP